ncbi:PLP-dependent transferase [Nemania serpens]|nr:PLP-dependent transferase [Nemania serpens]
MLPCPNAFRSIFRHDDGSYNWKAELDYGFDMVDKASCGSLAALIIEPILSSGGMHVLPDGYLRAIRKHCDDRSMLLIIDEAQTGLGRTGTMFAFEHDGVTPDILTLSKTLGNGYPLSVVVTSHAIAKSCQERGLFFGTTHVNDPLAAAVGLRVLGIAIRESLPERAKMLGDRLVSALEAIKEKNSSIGDIRGRGLLIGVEIIDGQTRAPNPALGLALCREMKQNGLWVNFSPTSSTFRIVPPSTTTMLELDAGIKIIKSVFQVQD